MAKCNNFVWIQIGRRNTSYTPTNTTKIHNNNAVGLAVREWFLRRQLNFFRVVVLVFVLQMRLLAILHFLFATSAQVPRVVANKKCKITNRRIWSTNTKTRTRKKFNWRRRFQKTIPGQPNWTLYCLTPPRYKLLRQRLRIDLYDIRYAFPAYWAWFVEC